MTTTSLLGTHRREKGCFTHEFALRGKTLEEIGKELGLPRDRLKQGAYICFAIKLPAIDEFELGGWAEFSTDKFVKYWQGEQQWSRLDFEKTYKDKRVPISVRKAKEAWGKNMLNHKLVKVLPVVGHQRQHVYPAGGQAPQIVVTQPVSCLVTNFMAAGTGRRFRGVWG